MPARFRLMTTNLLYDHVDLGDLARVVAMVEPDVVIAQELGPAAAEVLADLFSNHRLRPSLDFTGRGIATRLDADLGDISMPGRHGTAAVLDLGTSSVRLAGVHLVNPIQFPWWSAAATRRQQLDGLFEWVDKEPTRPIVVVGDFNASPSWPAYKRTASELTDLVAQNAEARKRRPERTWGWRPGWPRMLRIDHVFGRGLRATQVAVHQVRGTDHWAVVADIEVDSEA
jgi:endonuclease/exonuclease/phosphatase family metal-dependent hydrolase